MKRIFAIALASAAALSFASVHAEPKDSAHGHEHSGPTEAIAVLQAMGNSGVSGWVKFDNKNDGMQVTAEISGLTPGEHGFHIHEFGDLSSTDGTSAGGHFNPDGHKHGGPDSDERHAGDFGNLKADASGKAKFDLWVKGASVSGKNSILGRGVVVHAKADDLKTQPSGDAGGRIAVGVIGVRSAPAKK